MIQASKSLSPSHGSFKNAHGGVAYQGSEWIARRLNHLKGLGKGSCKLTKKKIHTPVCQVKTPGWCSDVLDIGRNWDGPLFAWPSAVTFQLCLALRLAMVWQV